MDIHRLLFNKIVDGIFKYIEEDVIKSMITNLPKTSS